MHDTSSNLKASRRRIGGLGREAGVSLLLACCALVFIVPLMGLVVDVGVLYVVRSRLQSSVDGAALAAARALNLGQTTAAQASSAKQNAVNWFYANFPSNNWKTTGTVMGTSDVNVFDDPNNAQLRNVTVSAYTYAPTYFMQWFSANSVKVVATGNASRRDVVAMLVLDRSGSMCGSVNTPCGASNTTTACAAMITAAKTFTGQFSAGRDRIGLISFSDGAYIHQTPTTDFQTQLGYVNTSGTGNGAIDTITCGGGTGTASAVSRAYNELYKQGLPGALNLLVLETDGLPNGGTFNLWDGSAFGLNSTSNCKDNQGKTVAGGGWTSSSKAPAWRSGITMGPNGYMSDIPAGPYGTWITADPSQSQFIFVMWDPIQGSGLSSVRIPTTSGTNTAYGCAWNVPAYYNSDYTYNDFDWLPSTDIFGNSVNPTNAYKSVTVSNGHIGLTNSTSSDYTNVHNATINLADNAAYRARANSTIPAYLFVIGLDSSGGTNPPDPVLLQRMANDPSGDTFNATPLYVPCAQATGCITYSSQPQGTFIYSPNAAQLNHAFLAISSQVLRLSR